MVLCYFTVYKNKNNIKYGRIKCFEELEQSFCFCILVYFSFWLAKVSGLIPTIFNFYLLSFPRKLDSSKRKIQWKINTYRHTYRVNIMYHNVLKNSNGK